MDMTGDVVPGIVARSNSIRTRIVHVIGCHCRFSLPLMVLSLVALW
jgi:hypothetical protein